MIYRTGSLIPPFLPKVITGGRQPANKCFKHPHREIPAQQTGGQVLFMELSDNEEEAIGRETSE